MSDNRRMTFVYGERVVDPKQYDMRVLLDQDQLLALAESAVRDGGDASLIEFSTGPLKVQLTKCGR